MKKELFKSYIFLMLIAAALIFGIQNPGLIVNIISSILSIFSSILLGMAIAFVLYRPYMMIYRLLDRTLMGKLKRAIPVLCIIMVYLGVIIFISIVFAFILPQISESAMTLYSNFDSYAITLEKYTQSAVDFLNLNNIDITTIDQAIENIPKFFAGIVSALFPKLFDMTTNLVANIADFIIAIVIAAYILTDKPNLKKYFSNVLIAYLPERISDKIFYVGRISYLTFTRFVGGQLTESVILGSLFFVGMLIFGFDYPLLISVLIGITSLIPVAGAFMGAIPSVFLILMVDPPRALWFIVFFLVLQQIEGDFIYPRVVGNSIGLPAIWVLIAIIIGAGIGGILGMLLSVPTASVIYQLINEDMERRLQKKQDV